MLFLASLLPGFVLPMLKAWLEAKEGTKRDTAMAIIREREAAYRDRAATIQASMGHAPFWFVWCLFAVPLGFWWALVCLDSIFLFSGSIPALPPSIVPWADQIFNSIFLSGGGVAGATIIGRAIARR